MSSVNFILPGTNDEPIGGYKVVYQYANELQKKGYEVHITFLYSLFSFKKKEWYVKLSKLKNDILGKKRYSQEITWFKLNPSITLHFDVIGLDEVEDCDYVLATAAPTANFVYQLPESKGEKFYFIQNYEEWWYPKGTNYLLDTYRLGLNNIVISSDLYKKVQDASGKAPVYLPNFYDNKEFYLVKGFESRSNTVSLLNHIQDTKRTQFGIEVLEEVKKIVPDLQVELFGAYPPICDLPDYFHFTYKANPQDLRENIFGKSKVYLLPSTLEGWGLTGTEAMACGAALVASDIGGIQEYANSSNSVLVAVKSKDDYVKAIVDLLTNEKKRIKLIEQAMMDVQQYTLSKAADKFEETLKNG